MRYKSPSRYAVTLLIAMLPTSVAWGQFGPQNDIISGNLRYSSRPFEAADLDGDGDLDLMVQEDSSLVWLPNADGAGNFGAAITLYTAPGGTIHYAMGDVDGDGSSDVVFAVELSGELFWMQNATGTGVFGTPQLIATFDVQTAAIGAIICTDLFGNGLADVATAHNGDIHVFTNTGGSFSTASIISSGSNLSSDLLYADMDVDGATDLISVDEAGVIRVTVNQGGAAEDWEVVEVGIFANWLVGLVLPQIFDMNSDGKPDVVLFGEWAKNNSTMGSVEPFEVGPVMDGGLQGFGYMIRHGCGNGVSLLHRGPISGNTAWYPYDPQSESFTYIPLDPPIGIIATVLGTADLNGDGQDDIVVSYPSMTNLAWFANNLLVEEPEPITLAPFDELCVLDSTYVLDHASIDGGIWSGPGVWNGIFNPSLAGAGSFTLSYRVAAPCPQVVNATIVVNPVTTAGLSLLPFDVLCASGGSYPLDGFASPDIGTWSGPGVVDNVFTPFTDDIFTLSYSIPDQCLAIEADIEVVYGATFELVSGEISDNCGTDPLQFQASPAGGTWTGSADENGVIDRSCAARPFIGTFGYEINAVNGGNCQTNFGQYFNFLPCTNLDIGDDRVLCSNADTLMVILQPPYPSGGASLGGFDLVVPQYNPPMSPTQVGYFSPNKPAGMYALTGFVGGPNMCPGMDTLWVTVVSAPEVLTGSYGPLCSSDEVIILSGLPEGGAWSGTGVNDNLFDPAAGTQTLTYTAEENGCTESAIISIEVSTAIPWYADLDEDGLGDPNDMLLACSQIEGYVDNADDPCPQLSYAAPGEPCDDSNPDTLDDTVGSDCICAGVLLDCAGVAGGGALPGTACDDGKQCTQDDMLDTDCVCVGTPVFTIGSITLPNNTVLENDIDTFSITPVDSATYLWTVPDESWVSADLTNSTLIVVVGSPAYSYHEICVSVTLLGCTQEVCDSIHVDGSVAVNNARNGSAWFTVNPNPSAGLFHLSPESDQNEATEIQVHDALGNLVAGPFQIPAQQPYTLRLEQSSSGVYFMRALRGDETTVLRLVIQR